MEVMARAVFPLIVDTVDDTFVEVIGKCRIIIIGRIISRLKVILKTLCYKPNAAIGLEIVNITKDLLVHGIGAVEIRRLLTHALAYIVEASAIELRYDSLVGNTGYKQRLFGIIVINIQHSGDGPVLGRPAS